MTKEKIRRRSISPGRAPPPGLPTPKVSSSKSSVSSNPQPSSPIAIIDPNVRRDRRSSASESRSLQNTVRTNEQTSRSHLQERQNATRSSTSGTIKKKPAVVIHQGNRGKMPSSKPPSRPPSRQG